MSNKAVVLCSGGFDSVTLVHNLRYNHPDLEIHTLFFNYGQRNYIKEYECAEKVSKKLNCKLHTVKIPPITWTKSNFYGDGYKNAETQYLEYRNLIFFSYALSLAQSCGAAEVYAAILKSHWGYADTSKEFINALNSLSQLQGISICTPYADLDKNDLGPIAYQCEVYTNEWFSCDVPKYDDKGEMIPCGECLDCKSLKGFEYQLLKSPTREIFTKQGFDPSTQNFKDSVIEYPIHELRVLVNNKCQLKCKHCFYGFDDMIEEKLNKDEMYKVIEDAIKLGVSSLHYSGKEPLFDDEVFYYIDRVKKSYPKITQSIVTNGINIKKYLDLIKIYGIELFVSLGGSLRKFEADSELISTILDNKIPLTVFVDLHKENFKDVHLIVKHLVERSKVKKIHIRTLRPIGNAELLNPLSQEEVKLALNNIYNYTCNNKGDYFITCDIGANYSDLFYAEGEVFDLIRENFVLGFTSLNDNLNIDIEVFCNKYLHTITISPDGYIFGCGMELANKNYSEISVGNVRNNTLKDLITKGKNHCVEVNKLCGIGENYCFNSCKFNV